MHELSIASSIVEIATQRATDAGADQVNSVTIRVGALTCVHRSALEFSFELVCQGTMLEGAKLNFTRVPVSVYCGICEREVELSGIQRFRCPVCDTPSADIRHGNELDIESIEVSGRALTSG